MMDTCIARNGDDFCGDDRVMRMLALAVWILATDLTPPVYAAPRRTEG